MKIAIDINGAIRDVFTKASFIYEKYYIDENPNSVLSEYDEKSGEWKQKDEDEIFDYKLNLPVESLI